MSVNEVENVYWEGVCLGGCVPGRVCAWEGGCLGGWVPGRVHA